MYLFIYLFVYYKRKIYIHINLYIIMENSFQLVIILLLNIYSREIPFFPFNKSRSTKGIEINMIKFKLF